MHWIHPTYWTSLLTNIVHCRVWVVYPQNLIAVAHCPLMPGLHMTCFGQWIWCRWYLSLLSRQKSSESVSNSYHLFCLCHEPSKVLDKAAPSTKILEWKTCMTELQSMTHASVALFSPLWPAHLLLTSTTTYPVNSPRSRVTGISQD
jgi:hypothetical protein